MNQQIERSEFNTVLTLKGFNVYETGLNSPGHNYSRKDFYKISLTSGSYSFHYADKSFETQGPILFFGIPAFHIPARSWHPHRMVTHACLPKIFLD